MQRVYIIVFSISRPRHGVNQDIVEELLRLFRRTTRDMATGLRVRYRDSYDSLEISIVVDCFISSYMRRFWSHPSANLTLVVYQRRCIEHHARMAGPNATPDLVSDLVTRRRSAYDFALQQDISTLLEEGASPSGQLRNLAGVAAPHVFSQDKSGHVANEGSGTLITWLHPLMRACTSQLRQVPHVKSHTKVQ